MTYQAVLHRGAMLPDFVLPMVDGGVLQLESYRGRRNLVVVCSGDDARPGPVTRLLNTLVARKDELEAEAAQVLSVVVSQPAESRDLGRWPFPMVVDPDGLFHRGVGATDGTGRPVPAVFVTDRFREIYAICSLPDAQEIIDWLRFINIQCPECGVPEWPA